ncbi:PAS domain S-box protein [Nocardioides panacis]|uniref:PAS domain S-box protein n=1 Tax=Nocardioides panacis TaxID=2849501 RepID=A0A975Y0Y5_9ACTN|nr:ATP-binding protein [Nocardioides panacis]QWZ08945.1 PAS domain S-box protein [Nocardioides panacis]
MGLTSSVTGHGSFEARLPPQPTSVAEARSLMRGLLGQTGRADLVETAVLLVSEVVTNALLHAGTDIDLAAVLGVDGLRVEVGDGSPHLPSRRRYAATAGTGRGLLMLESMVDDWGVTRRPGGKVVWFRISGPDLDLEDPVELRGDRAGRSDGRRDNVAVELRNVPLLLHAAWQEHAEALLREYLLASLDEPGGQDPIQMHADATDAIAVLEEHIPRTGVEMVADALMDDALEPGVSAAVIRVPVPRASVSHFATLDRAIEAALDLSREGLVLTPPTQPEVQAFRKWICRQVLSQASGARPEPWQVPADAVGAMVLPEGWDPTVVTRAAHGLIAADATSRILAVSAAAATLLGYDDPVELVGRRIVSIVPERYRQAHVAGFTMYLLVGRKPLLDRRVQIPALRRDGTEVEIELTVRSPGIGTGQSVLLADIRPARR